MTPTHIKLQAANTIPDEIHILLKRCPTPTSAATDPFHVQKVTTIIPKSQNVINLLQDIVTCVHEPTIKLLHNLLKDLNDHRHHKTTQILEDGLCNLDLARRIPPKSRLLVRATLTKSQLTAPTIAKLRAKLLRDH